MNMNEKQHQNKGNGRDRIKIGTKADITDKINWNEIQNKNETASTNKHASKSKCKNIDTSDNRKKNFCKNKCKSKHKKGNNYKNSNIENVN